MVGYRGPIDWSEAISSEFPWLRLRVRTWVLLEKRSESDDVASIWWEHDSSWMRIYPIYDGPGMPPGW